MLLTDNKELEDDGGQITCWYLPKPPPAGNPLDQDTLRTVIEDVVQELGVLIFSMPESEKSGVRNSEFHPQPSLKEIEKTLGCLDYQKKSMSRAEARNTNAEEDHP